MSTLWTPGGERPIRPASPPPGTGEPVRSSAPAADRSARGPGADYPSTPEEQAEALRQLEEAQQQLMAAPAEDIVANHCYGLFELAAAYLSARPPALDKARLAIDALGALLENLDGRLGAHEPEMREALTQIRLAYVQVQKASEGAANGDAGEDTPTTS